MALDLLGGFAGEEGNRFVRGILNKYWIFHQVIPSNMVKLNEER